MKAAIVSCYFIHNYGSILQSFATQQHLQNCGVDCETIAVEGLHDLLFKSKKFFYKKNITNISLLASKYPLIKLAVLQKLNWNGLRQKLSSRKNRFIRFQRRFRFSSITAADFEELSRLAVQYDAVILGGDQLWRPDNIYPGYYTLEWVPDKVKKISLGTSFGVSKLDSYSIKRAKIFLNRFDALSVRETTGQKIIYELTEREALLACDPVLLLSSDEWGRLSSDKLCPREDYIFTYFLGNNKKHREFAMKLGEETGLPVVAIPHIDSYLPIDEKLDIKQYDASPEEYIGLIKNARYVCTDSFHATVFSTLFHRDFFTFKRFSKNKSGTNTRIESLLNTLSLQERYINESFNVTSCIKMKSKFDKADAEIERLIAKTSKFIMESLSAPAVEPEVIKV